VSKRTITNWYIGAWMVWFVSLVALIVLAGREGARGPTTGMPFLYTAIVGSALLMFVMWIAALVKLARRQATFSFVVLLVLQLIGLGLIGMVAWAISGPEEVADFAIRPHMT
jgi:hypothetical protein